MVRIIILKHCWGSSYLDTNSGILLCMCCGHVWCRLPFNTFSLHHSAEGCISNYKQRVVYWRGKRAVPPKIFWGNAVPPINIRTRGNGKTVAFSQIRLQGNATYNIFVVLPLRISVLIASIDSSKNILLWTEQRVVQKGRRREWGEERARRGRGRKRYWYKANTSGTCCDDMSWWTQLW